jgi:tetratricopeptide (TPR) repeat protein
LSDKVPTTRFLWFAAACFATAFCQPAIAQRRQPTAASTAVVRADEIAVFAEMDSSGEKNSTLKKGATVYVDLRVDQSGKSWCGVRRPAEASRIGYVDCRALERVGGAHSLGVAGAADSLVWPSAAAEIPLAGPAIPTNAGYAAIRSQTIKEGVVDSGYITTLDQLAESGGSMAVTRAALAHLAAGEFQLSQHEPEKALEQFDAMDRFTGEQRDLLLASLAGHAQALTMKNEYSAVLETLDRERKLAPKSANLLALSGWAHYRLNQLDAAVADLQAAQRIQPDPRVARLLAKASRDKEAESDFREGESSHFVLHYHGGASRALASDVIHTLEDHFQWLRSELHYIPPEPIGVILYTQETFRDVTRVPAWAGGANDGRIRIPVQGIETVTPLLASILKHELTHSFVYQKSAGRCPTWLQEGTAQWMEGRRSAATAATLVAVYQDGKGKPLRYLDGPWTNLSGAQAQYAYAWALAVVESIEADSGGDGVGRLIDATRTESTSEEALHLALRTNYSGLDESTIEFLTRTYLQ